MSKNIEDCIPLKIGQNVRNRATKQLFEVITLNESRVMLKGLTGALSKDCYFPMPRKSMEKNFEIL